MGNRSQWLVRVAVLAVAIGAVSLAFAVVATVPSLTVVDIAFDTSIASHFLHTVDRPITPSHAT